MRSPTPPVSPWQLFYGGAHRLRCRWYQSRAKRLPKPVISIGNLHWGGTGKTPLVSTVAAHLRDLGLAVCILSRGYASQGKGVRIVSTGEGPLLEPLQAGDEPVLLATELPGVAVVVGPARYEAGLVALRDLPRPPDLFLLDDGFSHLALHRDLDIVAFPASDPFGGGRLLPSGRLREPLASIVRAHAVVMTGAGSSEDGRELAKALRPHGFTGPGFASSVRPARPEGLAVGARVFLVTAIARPERFAETARELGYEIAGELRFPDHHPYPAPTLEKISAALRSSGAVTVLTTAKDGVKLRDRLDVPFAVVPIRAEAEPEMWEWLDGAVKRARTR